jgi:hypothetical protein
LKSESMTAKALKVNACDQVARHQTGQNLPAGASVAARERPETGLARTEWRLH